MRKVAIMLLVGSLLAVAASAGLAAVQRDGARAAQGALLAHEAVQETAALEAYFERARVIILLTSRNPAFTAFYAQPRSRTTDGRAAERVRGDVNRALEYLERLYPGSIGEACLVGRGGTEDARLVRGVPARASELSPDESSNPFFAPTFALGVGGVRQARPYVSPDTGQWVISNSTVVPGGSAPRAFVHFEVTLESFRKAAASGRGRFKVGVVERRTGAIVLDSDTRQRAGAKLGLPNDRRYTSLRDTRDAHGAATIAHRRVAYQRVRRGAGNANDWLVVVASRTAQPSLLGSFTAGPIALVVFALLLAAFALLGGRARTLRHEADTDQLTGLANRRAFLRRLDTALRHAGKDDRSVALLMIDLDHFKELNDTMGHHTGDLLLQQVGPRLRQALREADTLARLGGDEFAVVLTDLPDRDTAERVAQRIRALLAEPFLLEELAMHVSASIGIAQFPEHANDGGTLLQRADVAMYQAKQAGTECELYDASRDIHSRERLALVGDLRRALHDNEFEVHFQPKADLRTGRVDAVEALVRWQHPERGLLAPGQFIPLVAQSGLIRPLTRYVLDATLAQAATWRRAGHDIKVAVNVSAPDLMDARFPDHVLAALTRHAIPPERLQLEITEDTIIADPERMLDVLARLSEVGVGLSLDDYGTGRSSLAYLKRLPIQELKIDRSFVMHLTADSQDATIVRSTINLAHSLRLRVVAEGVETAEAWAQLGDMGCELAQGYLVSRPQPAAALDALLQHGFTPAAR
jgi:diguanylate cyclase (GGDEF)-like protein